MYNDLGKIKSKPTVIGFDEERNQVPFEIKPIWPTNRIGVSTHLGDDTTAVKYTDKMFKTVKAAMLAATAGDEIFVYPGLYDEYNIAPVHNSTLYLTYGTLIQPSANGGNVPVLTDLAIPNWSSVTYTMEMNFKIRGRGKIINKGASAQYNNAALMLVLAKSRWDVELETLSGYQIYGGSSLIIRNAKITLSTCAFRHSLNVMPNVEHIECTFENANVGCGLPIGVMGNKHLSYYRCKFIRTVTISEFDELVTGPSIWGVPLGLNTVHYINTNIGHQIGSYEEFIDCEFYNYIGGDNFVLTDSQGSNANILLKSCRFFNSNSDLTRGTGKAVKVLNGLGTATKLYMSENIADTLPEYAVGALTTNLLPGTGFIISDNNLGAGFYSRLIGQRNWN